MLSVFDTDIFIYQYPKSIDALSEDLKHNFSSRFRVTDALKSSKSFKIKYNNRLSAEIEACVVHHIDNALTIEMEINANPTLNLIVSGALICLVFIFSTNYIVPLVMTNFLLVLVAAEYFFKIKLKKEFEINLNLPVKVSPDGHKFKLA